MRCFGPIFPESALLPATLPYGIPAHLNPVGIVNEAVEDTVCDWWITDLFVPPCHGHLRGQDHAPSLITLFTDLPEIPAFRFGEGRHCPVIYYQQINTADAGKEMAETSIGARKGELAKQRSRSRVKRGLPIPAGFLRQG